MDIAVDGLAIDLLAPEELGLGNIAQVVGYKLGMLMGGGLLVWASEWIGWTGLFGTMAGIVAFAIAVVVAVGTREGQGEPAGSHPTIGLRDILRRLVDAARTPGAGWLLVFVATYKIGESMADVMFKPFLVDAGFDRGDIGLWVGTWGMVFSIAGSVAGGWLASRISMLGAVAITATLRAAAVGGEWWLSVVTPTTAKLIAVTGAEHLFGGAITTAMFAFMMSRIDRRIGATHYTAIATVEVLGKVPASWLSGVLGQALGYPGLFALATALSIGFLGLLFPLRRALPAGA
jgi:hypothetical protein